MILQIIEDALFSAIAAIGFASLSNPPRRACLASGLIAAVGHSVRFVLMEFTALDLHIVVATAIASLIIGVLAVVVSSRTKVPAEACLYPSLLPMFPGIYAYRTFGALVMCLYKGSEGAFNHYFYLFASNFAGHGCRRDDTFVRNEAHIVSGHAARSHAGALGRVSELLFLIL